MLATESQTPTPAAPTKVNRFGLERALFDGYQKNGVKVFLYGKKRTAAQGDKVWRIYYQLARPTSIEKAAQENGEIPTARDIAYIADFMTAKKTALLARLDVRNDTDALSFIGGRCVAIAECWSKDGNTHHTEEDQVLADVVVEGL